MNAIVMETNSTRSPLRCYWLEARCEFLRVLRAPSFAVPTLVFAPMFYLLFGVLLNGGHGNKATSYLLATYGVFGVMAPGLFGFGVAMAMAMMFAAMVSIILASLALTFGHVVLSPLQLLALFATNILGVLPFCAIGLYIGTVFSAQAAPAVINLLYLPMAVLAGLWMPLSMLPALFAKLAPLWPAYHLAQVALAVVGLDNGGSVALHALVLLAVSVVFFGLARRRLARA